MGWSVVVAVCLTTCLGVPDPLTVASPDGRVVFTFSVREPGLVFSITFDGRPVVLDSPLGLRPQDAEPLGTKLQILDSHLVDHDETWSPVCGPASAIRDHYRQLSVELAESCPDPRRLGLAVRAYDNGVAFRYEIPGPAREVRLDGELTAFRLPADTTAFALPLKDFHTSYEGAYTIGPVGELADRLIGLPITVELATGQWLAITEAHLNDYPGLYLAGSKDHPDLLDTRLSRRGEAPPAIRSAPFVTPWRVIMLARRAGELIGNHIVDNCNPPAAIADTSWIRPGRVTWDWWSKQMVNGVDFAGGMDTATMKHYARFAAEAGFEYLLIDEGWSWWENVPDDKTGKPRRVTDITRPIPALDLPELLAYCDQLGVRVWLWLTWGHCAAQMAEAFPLYERWGVAGVKIDFMNRDDQWMVNWYHEVAELAARHHLMVDFHGAYKPTGMSRTWPNVLTFEAVMGLECAKWSSDITPTHNVTIPFIRMLAGPMDYTPGGFNVITPDRFKPRDSAPFVMGTRCHQLAQYVVYDSPLQMCADYPESYRGAVGFEFLRWVPTTWDETRVIDGRPAEFVAIARRHGHAWYVGCMTNNNPRTIDMPLGFLGDGRWRLDEFADGPRAVEVPEQIRRMRRMVTATDTVRVEMAPGGGYAARLLPEAHEESPTGRVRHLVGFRFAEGITAEKKGELLDALDRLPDQIPCILGYERGPNLPAPGLAHDIDHALMMTFGSRDKLTEYLRHPARQAFSEKYGPWLADSLVVNWRAEQD